VCGNRASCRHRRYAYLITSVEDHAKVIPPGGTYPALAVLFSRILDAFALTGQAMLDRGDFYALMFFVMALGNLFAYAAMGWMSSIVSQQIMRSYRLEIFNNVLRQEMPFFDDPDNGTGALVSRLSTEPTALQELLSSNIALILTITVNLVSSCVLAVSYGWKLGLVLTFGALPPLVASGYVRIRLEFKLDDDTASRFANSAGIATEAVSAIRTVASLAMEKEILSKYEGSLRSIARTSVKSLVGTMLWYALSQSISFLSMALGFWYGGRLISFGEYTSQQFYTVFIAVIFSGEAAASLFQYTSSITQAQGAANYVFNLRRQVGRDMKDNYPPGREDGVVGAVQVECKDLGFSYPRRPGSKVLKDISLSVQPGQFVAFVGASGCGKTTMLSLLERFYEPTSGTIFLDGADSLSLHLGQYRRHIALVQQEPVLYQGSLRENISLGIEDLSDGGGSIVTDEEILEVCHQANIDTFIASLPDGLSTRCGSQGLQFSGGQRQRIAIARALMRKPRLLLLDEATSSLDSESEKVVQTALDGAAKGERTKRTTVAVAHRLSTVRNADVIFVFSQGRIVETGSHDELVRKRGTYYQMCLAQSLDQHV
jgi:ATP-binding cassette subfamily B (MDR/TAP) protein 1